MRSDLCRTVPREESGGVVPEGFQVPEGDYQQEGEGVLPENQRRTGESHATQTFDDAPSSIFVCLCVLRVHVSRVHIGQHIAEQKYKIQNTKQKTKYNT